MPTALINDLTMFYQDTGEQEPVLLLAGLGSEHTLWQPVVQALTDQHRCITPDNRGSGQTGTPMEPYSVEQMAQDTLGLLDSLGLEQVHVVGLCLGGMITQAIAKLAPGRLLTMALVDTAAVIDGRTEAVLAAWKLMIRRMERRECLRAIAPWLLGPGAFQRLELLERFVSAGVDLPHPQPEYAFDHQANAMASFDSRSFLQDIRIPTAVIVGENDLLTPMHIARPLAESIKGSQLVILPAAGHLSPFEQPLAFIEALESLWLRGRATG